MPKDNNIDVILEDVKKEAEQLAGWDELKVVSINKYGGEAVVKTDRGDIKISMRDIFTQYYFRLKVFETFGLMIPKVKENIYEKWLGEWSKLITDMGGELGTSIDILRESLESYTEGAEERDSAYLRRGEPILTHDGTVAFRALDFQIWLKKKGLIFTSDQLNMILRDLGCKPTQIGKQRTRAWKYKQKDYDDSLFQELKND